MTWREALRNRSPLARRLILWTVLFSSAITLVLTLFQLYRDYRVDVSAIEDHLNQIERVHLPTIARSLWATDQSRLQLQLEGILQLSDMHFVEVREADFVWASAGRLESKNVIRREVPIVYVHDGRQQVLGTLTAAATLDDVYARLFSKTVTILVSNAIKTFLVALFILMLFHQLVTRHLQRIGQWLTDHEKTSPPLTLDRTTPAPDGDEFDILTRTLNSFRDGQAQVLEAVETEQQRYISLFESANDMIYIVEPGSGRIRDANRRASEVTGYLRDELLQMNVKELGLSEDDRVVETALRQLEETGTGIFERCYRRKDGSVFPVEISSRVVSVGRERVIESFVRDISERKRAETLREDQSRTLEQLLEGAPLPRVLDTLVRTIETQIEDGIGSVLLLDPDGRRLRHGAAPHLPEAYNRAIDGGAIGPAAGSCGTAAHERRRVVVEDIQTDPRWVDYRELAAAHNLRACWSEPIMTSAGKVLGTFAMYYRESRRPSEDDLRLIEEARHLAAVVIEHSHAQQALTESEKRFRVTFEQAAVGVALVTLNGCWLRVNRKLCDIVGYTHEELLTRTFQDITHPDDLGADLAQAVKMLAGEIQSYSMEKRYVRKDKHIVWINLTVSLQRTASGEPEYFIAVVEDISERKRAESVLHERDEVLRLFVEHSPAAIAMLDSEMRYVAVSRRWMADYGLDEPNLIGRSHYEVFPEIPQHWKDIHQRCLAGATERCDEDPFARDDGHTDWVKWEICPWRKGDGEIGGIIMFTELVTARKQAETEREKFLAELTARNIEMENFVYTISHDLKTPLITIGGFASLLKKDLAKNDLVTAHDSLAEIDKAVEQMKGHIEDLLMLSRTGRVATEKTRIDPAELIASVLKLFGKRIEGSQVRVNIARDLPAIKVDPKGFQRVFSNLIDNALKYRREDVTLLIEIGATRTEDTIRFFVRDNGSGIRARYRERIFELFQRADSRTEGTGVGLAIARRVIEVHDGRMWVDSETGKGSTFWIELPVSVIVDTGSKST